MAGKRRALEKGGALDAFVHALAGLGATSRWTGLPPRAGATTLARAVGEGIIEGRRRGKGHDAADAPPVDAEDLDHEGQRGVAELGSILWHAMSGPDTAPALSRWIPRPHTDPIIALTLSRRRRAQYAEREPLDRNTIFPGPRVWLFEIERAKGEIPDAIAVWRSPERDGAPATRCACVWTHGRMGTQTHPLVIAARWNADAGDAHAGACVLGPSADDARRAAGDAGRQTLLRRRQDAIGKEWMAKIAIPAALAWVDRHGGHAPRAGQIGGGHCESECGPVIAPIAAPERTGIPHWVSTKRIRAVEAIVLDTAREGYRIGPSCTVDAWRRGWAGYAEMAAAAWRAGYDGRKPLDTEAWEAVARGLAENTLGGNTNAAALSATSALVHKMLAQTGRSDVVWGEDDRRLCALEIPSRLWRALAEAGPRPSPASIELDMRWWLVEIEAPCEEEPNAVALWKDGEDVVTLAAFLCDDEPGRPRFVTIVTWRTCAAGTRKGEGLAALKQPIHINDPTNAENRDALRHVIETLAEPETGAIARANSAIALHLETVERPAPLGAYRASRSGESQATTRREHAASQWLFAIERAPQPEPAARGDGSGVGNRGERGALEELQHVRAHWKRQAFGPRLTRRRLIIVKDYERGPKPREDQIVLTRLAQAQTPIDIPDRRRDQPGSQD